MISETRRQIARDAWTALRIANALHVDLPKRERFILERQACLIPLERIGADPHGLDGYYRQYWPYTRERIRQLANEAKRYVRTVGEDTPAWFYYHERFGDLS